MCLRRLIILLVVLGLLAAGVVLGLPWVLERLGVPLTASGVEDMHFNLNNDGYGRHVRYKRGYGLILECQGRVQSPPGRYRVKIVTSGGTRIEREFEAGKWVSYRLFTGMGFKPTMFRHEIWGLSGQRDVRVTVIFKWSYNYKSILSRLLGQEKPPFEVAKVKAPAGSATRAVSGLVSKPAKPAATRSYGPPTAPPPTVKRTTGERITPPPDASGAIPPIPKPPPDELLPAPPWKRSQ